MYALTTTILLSLAMSGDSGTTDFLSNARYRQLDDVAAELDTLSHLSPSAFDVASPSVVRLLRNTKSTALKIRSLDLLCSKASPTRWAEAFAYLNECVDALQAAKNVQSHALVEAFVSADLSTWGNGIRNCPEALVLLNRIARNDRVDPGVAAMATMTIYEVASNDAAKRQAMLMLIQDRTHGSDKAAVLLPPIADTATIVALRTLLDQGDMNLNAARALAELGDAGALPILNRRKTELEAQVGQPYHDQLEYVRRAIHAIEISQNNATLIAFIRSSASDGDLFPFNKFWAVQKAQSRGVGATELRSAVLEWATNARPHERGDIKAFGIETGILNATDLPDAGPSLSRRFVHAMHVVRRMGPVPVPARKEKQGTSTTWEPNEANYPALDEWMMSVQWESVGSEAAGMLKAKLCELDLLHPANCMN